jgi:Rap1a immunity proteins
MNRLKRIAAAVGLLLVHSAGHCNATFWSGTKLIQILEADMRGEASYNVGLASGYILGVSDAVSGVLICIEDEVSVKQVKQVVFNYMKSRPEQWNRSANYSVVNALREVWPCKK